jgi:predicted DsbA family dithiol-disulfide isomerase
VAPYGDKYCVVKVEDVQKIMSYGITGTPGLVIDGKVVLSGRLPSAEEIRSFLG